MRNIFGRGLELNNFRPSPAGCWLLAAGWARRRVCLLRLRGRGLNFETESEYKTLAFGRFM